MFGVGRLRNPCLRIADIGNGRVWANAEGVQDAFPVRSGVRYAEDLHPVQKTSAFVHPDWLVTLPVRRVQARERLQMPGAALHSSFDAIPYLRQGVGTAQI